MVSREKGDIFFFVNEASKYWPDFISKPVVGCINCMASFHGTIVQVLYYWLIGYMPTVKDAAITWVLVTVICAGTTGIVWVIYRYFEIFCKLNREA